MKKQYHYTIVAFVIGFLIYFVSAFSFAQSKKEVKEAEKQRDKYVFNVKLKNKNVSEKIYFKLYKGTVIIPITISNKTYNFIFDTGAQTLLSDSLAKKLNAIQSKYSILCSDGAGISKSMDFYSVDDVHVGSLCFDNVGYGVANLDIFEKHLCMRIDGLLGTNILRLLNWEIDFSNQIITVSDKPFSATNYTMLIPFKESFSRTPEIKMGMGEYSFWATLDMGYNDLIEIPDSLFFKSRVSHYLKYAKGEGKSSETLFNDETPQNQYMSAIDSLYIGNNLLFNEVVNITPSPVILIGNAFLMQYGKVAINWKQQKIFLEKTAENKTTENNIFEFTPNLQDDKLIISFIWENSDMYRKGIKIGDQIIGINEISTERINSSQWCEIKEKIDRLENLTIEILKQSGEKTTTFVKKTTHKALIESK